MPKRGENIYKRKDGRWEGRYIRGRTASGQAEYGYVYADSYKACRAKRQQCIETLPEKPAVQASAATLAQAADRKQCGQIIRVMTVAIFSSPCFSMYR